VELILTDDKCIDTPAGKFTAVGVKVPENITFEEYEQALSFAARAEGASQFWIGDLLNAAEGKWGEMYTQAIEMTGLSYQSIANAKWVCSKVQFSDRSEKLGFQHHQKLASLPSDQQRKWLTKAAEESWSAAEMVKQIHEDNRIEVQRSAPPSPTKQYRCITLDPPWPMEKIHRDVREQQGKFLDYPIMSIEEIMALPIGEMAEENCHIYLWVTQKFLPDGLMLMNAWGFRYQCLMTWVKPTGMTPFSWMYNTEHVLFGRKGSLDLDQKGLKLSFLC